MNNESHQFELLSAYLDKEVTAEEQAEVEQLLESDPEARRVLEQIAVMGDFLRDLPRQQAGGSFSTAVMDQVRQHATHAAGSRPADAQHDHSAAEHRSSEHVVLAAGDTEWSSTRRSRHIRFVWVLVACAAALLVLAYPLGLYDSGSDRPGGAVVEHGGEGNSGTGVLNGNIQQNDGSGGGNGRPSAEAIVEDFADPEGGSGTDPAPDALVENLPATGRPPAVVPVPGSLSLPPEFTAEDQQVLRLLETLVVVKIECTPATAKAREFDKILAKYKIKVAEKATPPRPADAPPPATEVYYIESSAAQAEAVINEVSNRNNEFISIALNTETELTPNARNGAAGASQGEREDQEQPQSEREIPAAEAAPAAADASGSPFQENGSFAERFHVPTRAELEALRQRGGGPLSASDVVPFIQGQQGLDSMMGPSPVKTEHLVRMLVVLNTVEAKQDE